MNSLKELLKVMKIDYKNKESIITIGQIISIAKALNISGIEVMKEIGKLK